MSGSFGRTKTTSADRQLVRALAHPVRAEALTTLNARTASPNEIANELDLPVGTVSYHVNVLQKLDCVELVRTAQRRGATEHYYRGVALRYLDDGFWAKLSDAVRNGISMTALRVLIGAARDSVKAGIFDRRKDRHASVVTYSMDEQGWVEANGLLNDTLKEVMKIGTESEERVAKDPDIAQIRATFGLLGFESS
jgi:DNA-binding transcriptional ArsR family regulator